MWYRFNRDDLRVIAHYLGLLVMTLGVIMAVPLAVSIIYREWAISSHYIFGMGLALVLGTLFRLIKIEPQRLGSKHAIAITGMVWIVGAMLAAVPLFLSGHYATYLDAVFEGVSGLTATGLSLAQDVDHMSMADNMWRFAMQFIGGQGVVVVALSLGIFTRTGNVLYSSEARDESVVPNVKKTARFILQFSTAAVIIGTLVSTVILLLIGVEPLRGFFHALWITIGAYDTGGFAPVSLSLIPYHSWPLEIITMVFMMLGAISFAVLAQVQKGNWRDFVRDIEVRTLALWTVGMVVIFVSALGVGTFLTDFPSLMRRGIFTIISATTNTGFQILTSAQMSTLLPSGALLLLVVSMAVGGSSASTAGGIKALRVGLVFKGIALQIRRILQPRSARVNAYYNHIGRHQLTPELLASALIIASLYVISYVLGILVGIAYGYEALDATFESISAASNVGLSSGIVQVGMPVPLEVFYILQMWLGRLEFITLLALFAALLASIVPRRRPKSDKKARRLNATKSDRKTSRLQTNGNDKKESRLQATSSDKKTSRLKLKERISKGSIASKAALLTALLLTLALVLAPLQSAFGGTHTSVSPHTVVLSEAQSAFSGTHTSAAPHTVVLSEAQSAQPKDPDYAHAGTEREVNATGSDIEVEITISDLTTAPSYLDNVKVIFEGEVVGDRINAGADHVWVTLRDGENAITVMLPREYEDQIQYLGRYAYEGTHVRITGEFHLSCSEHEGASDVHATAILEVTDPGGPRESLPDPMFLVGGLVLIAAAGGFFALYSFLIRKRR